jgi:hypothetical protein
MTQFLLTLDPSKSELLRSVLNEVLNGFALNNFDAVIGLNRGELHTLLSHLCYLSGDEKVTLISVRPEHSETRYGRVCVNWAQKNFTREPRTHSTRGKGC